MPYSNPEKDGMLGHGVWELVLSVFTCTVFLTLKGRLSSMGGISLNC